VSQAGDTGLTEPLDIGDTTATTRVAALDLGSNSFHLLVGEVGGDGTIVPVLREKVMLRLGDTVARTGRLGDRSHEIVQTLRRLRAMVDSTAADEMVVCATAAIRDAEDRDEIVSLVRDETGIDIRVITGAQEAALIFSAVRASLVLQPSPALCLDLGGGSLELTIGDSNGLHWSASVPLGVARLTAAAVRDDPPTKRDRKRLRAAIAAALDPLDDVIAEHAPQMLVGTSGTLLDLAAVALHRRTGALPTSLNQVVVGADELAEVHDLLSAMTDAQRRDVAGLEPRRAEVVVAGSTLLLEVLDRYEMQTLTVGEWALREGMLLEAAGRLHLPHPRAIRRGSVLDLCRRFGWPEAHSRHVAVLAVSLFDQTHGLHHLDEAERELLEYGALLHDIGGHVSAEDHDHHTAYLIQHGRLRGFDPDEVAVLACLGRYHRRGRPRTDFAAYDTLRPDRRLVVDMLAGLLRLAHGLDHGRTGMVAGVEVALDDQQARFTVVTHEPSDADLEVWGASRAAKQFVRAFGRQPTFTVLPSSQASVA
jgi:exopolyphosphatase / guanosine-5'-triphosphate,3'-diphosphate pyrophosphatase